MNCAPRPPPNRQWPSPSHLEQWCGVVSREKVKTHSRGGKQTTAAAACHPTQAPRWLRWWAGAAHLLPLAFMHHALHWGIAVLLLAIQESWTPAFLHCDLLRFLWVQAVGCVRLSRFLWVA
jgi:hypothetical protein